MWTEGFRKRIYHQLTASEFTVALSLKVHKLPLKINLHMEKMYGVFTSRSQLLHSIAQITWLVEERCVTFHKCKQFLHVGQYKGLS